MDTNAHFNMYNTGRINSALQYDCLYYYLRDDIVKYTKLSHMTHQIIPYCIRPLNQSDDNMFLPATVMHGTMVTFETLNKSNITSKQLLEWSTSIDLAEHYQSYLISSSKLSSSSQYFYNCSPPWFGQFCQYTLFESTHLFADIVKEVYQTKVAGTIGDPSPTDHTNLTCYTQVECSRGLPSICLDWREVCDGVIHCIDDGADEQYCLELEINECDKNEYRCHNGLCIPEVFLDDDESNPDCLDGTDEKKLMSFEYMQECYQDPAFRCEERSASGHSFVCGDGKFVDGTLLTDFNGCQNRRKSLYTRAVMSHDNNLALSYACWSALICLHPLKPNDLDCLQVCMYNRSYCRDMVRIQCPGYFFFPDYPVAFGHVRFVYLSNRTDFMTAPDFVCYKEQLCEFLPSITQINGSLSTCRYFHELFSDHIPLETWMDLEFAIQSLFGACSTTANRNDSHQLPTIYQCNKSFKFISIHRVVDGFKDCYQGDDEKFDACELKDKHRFLCTSQNKCFSPVCVLDDYEHCVAGDDEAKIIGQRRNAEVLFPNVCDGSTDVVTVSVDGVEETDETNCEQWPCNHLYNRCDGHWDCFNGADEVDCSSSLGCARDEHSCVSPITFNLTCLPISRAGDGKVDCVGSFDERKYCRDMYPDDLHYRYRCTNSPDCFMRSSVCSIRVCPHDEKTMLCQNGDDRSDCEGIWANLCQLNDQKRPAEPLFFSLVTFSLRNEYHLSSRKKKLEKPYVQSTIASGSILDFRRAWLCNRGIPIQRGDLSEERCLCPPAYYGHRCQYQNQRVSLTIQFRKRSLPETWRIVYYFVITLIDGDEQQMINSHDQVIYVPTRDCSYKFNVYLIYRSRPKEPTKTYFVRIDGFVTNSLAYYSSWYLPVLFNFLPVNRLAAQLIIPAQRASIQKSCRLPCNHGQCLMFENTREPFCRCDEGWSGAQCNITNECNCSSDSICAGLSNNQSICVCPLGKFGPRCMLTHTVCRPDPCRNGGVCVPDDERVSEVKFTCICPLTFSGRICEIIDTKIQISFMSIRIPSSMLVHFITVFNDAHPERITTFKKIPVDRDTVILHISNMFHIIFVEIDRNYYLALLQEKYTESSNLSTTITPNHYCPHIRELFNVSIITSPLLNRVKYYHAPCSDRLKLMCFYDDVYLCLCTSDRQTNCFDFNHNVTYTCEANTEYCENRAQCFQDHPNCPSSLLCVCAECFFGTICQLSTSGFGLSLDAILGYQIRPNAPIHRQSLVVKISVALTTIMSVFGFINGISSTIVFQAKKPRDVGCGIYLLASSIISLLTTIAFIVKFWLLVVSQMTLITNRSFLLFHCVLVDFLLKILLSMTNWLNACVAIERALTVLKGAQFDKNRSKQAARWITFAVILFATSTTVHDPIHRRLVDDNDEQRVWCVVSYTPSLDIYNWIVNLLHFVVPFIINLISASVIIITAARSRAQARTHQTYKQHLRQQFQEHKHLLISPCVLVILASPRLVISFLSGCMKSAREPWLFLIGYFISFIPPTLTFFVFVLPSEAYKKEFWGSIQAHRAFLWRWLRLN